MHVLLTLTPIVCPHNVLKLCNKLTFRCLGVQDRWGAGSSMLLFIKYVEQ